MINELMNLLAICDTLNINQLLITPNYIKGCNESSTINLNEHHNLINVDCKIGLRPPSSLYNRLVFFGNDDSTKIIFNKHDSGEYIKNILCSKGKNKIEYTCTSPIFLEKKIPTEIKYKKGWNFFIPKPVISNIIKAMALMKSKYIRFVKNNNDFYAIIEDSASDKFEIFISDELEWIADDNEPNYINVMFNKENIQPILKSLLSSESDVQFNIGYEHLKQLLSININGYNVLVNPDIDSDVDDDD